MGFSWNCLLCSQQFQALTILPFQYKSFSQKQLYQNFKFILTTLQMKEVRLSRETFREASILLSLKAAQPIKCFTCNTFITDSESAKSLADLSSEWEVMISPAMNERLLYAETQRSCLGWVMRALLKWAVIAEEERGENHYSRGCLLGVSSHSWGLTKGLPTERTTNRSVQRA